MKPKKPTKSAAKSASSKKRLFAIAVLLTSLLIAVPGVFFYKLHVHSQRVIEEESKSFTAARESLLELQTTLEKVEPQVKWEFDAYCRYVNNYFSRGERTCHTLLKINEKFDNPNKALGEYISALETRRDLVRKIKEPQVIHDYNENIKEEIGYSYSFSKLENTKILGCGVGASIYRDSTLDIQITCSGNASKEHYPCKNEIASRCDH